jgi:hypothetical protein
MTDKQILGGRGSAKPFTTLNSIKLMYEIDQLKAENKRLEEELQAKEQECEASHGYILRLEEELEIEEAEALRAEVIMLEKTEETDKYKQALTEIKEIITKSCIDVDDDDYIHLSHMKQILQKCEVIDG